MFMTGEELGILLDEERRYMVEVLEEAQAAGIGELEPHAEKAIRMGYRTLLLMRLEIKKSKERK